MTSIRYNRTKVEEVIKDSQLFTQVEPEWLAENGSVTYINRSRGVLLTVDRTAPSAATNSLARFFYDVGQDTYTSSGWYDAEELTRWIFPVMKSDKAWSHLQDNTRKGNSDISLSADLT